MAEVNLVTGYRGEVHVSAVDQRNLNAAYFGKNEYVLENNEQFNLEVLSNNQVRVYSGDGMMQGAHFRINEGEYVDLSIENGIAGYERHDLVIARYTKDSITGVEKVEFVVKKGTATDGTAQDPTLTTGDVTNGEALVNEMALWRIPLDGLNVETPVKLFEVKEDMSNLWKIMFPVGYLYTSTNSTSPALLYGGTWERIKDCSIYAAGDSDSVGSIVGSNTHQLTVAELPSHTHGLNSHTHSLNNHTHSIPALSGSTGTAGNHAHTTSWIGGEDKSFMAIGQGGSAYTVSNPFHSGTNYAGDHTHTVTTNASTTGGNSGNTSGPSNNTTTSTGSGTAIDMRGARYNVYAWRRIA